MSGEIVGSKKDGVRSVTPFQTRPWWRWACGALALALVLASGARAGDLDNMNFQGRLVDAAGRPLNTTKSVTFTIRENSVAIWTQTQTVAFKRGVFSVVLGGATQPLSARNLPVGSPGPGHVFSGDETASYDIVLEIDSHSYPAIPIQRVPRAIDAAMLGGKSSTDYVPNELQATGDLLTKGVGGAVERLAIGSANQVLKVSASQTLEWQEDVGFANPLSNLGEIMVGGSGGQPTALGPGNNGQILTIVNGEPAWQDAPTSGFANPMSAAGSLIVGGSGGVATELLRGQDGQILKVQSGALVWADEASGMSNPMTAENDLVVGGSSGSATRLAVGSAYQTLSVNRSGDLAWRVPAVEQNINVQYTNASTVALIGNTYSPPIVVFVSNATLFAESIPVHVTSYLTANLALSGKGGRIGGVSEDSKKGYYLYLLYDETGAEPPALVFHTASTLFGVTLPSTYSHYSRALFFVYNDASSNILKFTTFGHNSRGCLYDTSIEVLDSGTATSESNVDITDTVPVYARVFEAGMFALNTSSSYTHIYLKDSEGNGVYSQGIHNAVGNDLGRVERIRIPLHDSNLTDAIKYNFLYWTGSQECTLSIWGWQR